MHFLSFNFLGFNMSPEPKPRPRNKNEKNKPNPHPYNKPKPLRKDKTRPNPLDPDNFDPLGFKGTIFDDAIMNDPTGHKKRSIDDVQETGTEEVDFGGQTPHLGNVWEFEADEQEMKFLQEQLLQYHSKNMLSQEMIDMFNLRYNSFLRYEDIQREQEKRQNKILDSAAEKQNKDNSIVPVTDDHAAAMMAAAGDLNQSFLHGVLTQYMIDEYNHRFNQDITYERIKEYNCNNGETID